MLNSLQYLRAVAALMVLVFHTTNPLRGIGYHGFWPMAGQNGVDIFFVLSGFLMLVTTHGKTDHAAAFLQKRLVRIVPLYWIVTTVYLVVLLATPGAMAAAKIGGWHIFTTYLFVAARHPIEHHIFPLVTPGWTLNCEMFFYLIWGMVLFLPNRWRAPTAAGVLIGLVILGQLLPHKGVAAVFYTSTILLEFIFGLALGVWYVSSRTAPKWVGASLMLLGFGLLNVLSATAFDRVLTWGAPAALVVAGALVLEKAKAVPTMPVLQFLGDASYSIYIVHALVLQAISYLWPSTPFVGMPGEWVLFAFLCLAGGLSAGIATYLFVEKPLLGLMGRGSLGRASKPALATG